MRIHQGRQSFLKKTNRNEYSINRELVFWGVEIEGQSIFNIKSRKQKHSIPGKGEGQRQEMNPHKNMG
jgi:hypothetical protein